MWCTGSSPCARPSTTPPSCGSRRDYDRPARDREVDRVIGDLGLLDHQQTTIARLSGGQRKRTSVAMELLTQPHLLCWTGRPPGSTLAWISTS